MELELLRQRVIDQDAVITELTAKTEVQAELIQELMSANKNLHIALAQYQVNRGEHE